MGVCKKKPTEKNVTKKRRPFMSKKRRPSWIHTIIQAAREAVKEINVNETIKVNQTAVESKKNATECKFCEECVREIDIDFPKWTGFGSLKSFEDLFSQITTGLLKNVGRELEGSIEAMCEIKSNGTDVSSLCKKMVDGVETVAREHKKVDGEFKLCKLMDMCDE